MPKTIIVCSEKGGCGKSTVCEEIAYSLDRTNTRYSFYDLDGQGGTHHAGHVVDNPDVVLVDTPAGMNDATLRGLPQADLVVITTNPTPREVQPLSRTIGMVQKLSNAPILIVVTRMNHFTVADQFIDWLEERVGLGNVCALPQSEAFPQSDGRRCSVIDVSKNGKAAEAVYAMCMAFRRLAGLEQESVSGVRSSLEVLTSMRLSHDREKKEIAKREQARSDALHAAANASREAREAHEALMAEAEEYWATHGAV